MKEDVAPRVGAHRLVRYADDFVIAFRNRRDGERVLAVLGKRLARFGLVLHDGKTRFVDFRPMQRQGGGHDGQGKFDFLGFTHLWGKSRRGRLVVRQFTARDRLARAAKSIWNWCKGNRHLPLHEQHGHLVRVIRGHCGYYGLTGNGKQLSQFRRAVVRSWHRWLGRRHRDGRMPWARMTEILTLFPLPQAKAVHSIYAK